MFCLFGVLRRFQHCTGHITTGSWKGRGNQYIEFARVVYCKLPTNGKQLPAFPLEPVRGSNPGLRGGRRECYHSATVAPVYIQWLSTFNTTCISEQVLFLSSSCKEVLQQLKLYFSKPFAAPNFYVLLYFHLESEVQNTKSADTEPVNRH